MVFQKSGEDEVTVNRRKKEKMQGDQSKEGGKYRCNFFNVIKMRKSC